MYKISYIGDDITTEFLFAFPFFQEADVRVALNGNVLTQNEYAVWPNEDFTGGSIIFPSPPKMDTKIDIFRKVFLSRTIDYQPTAKIDPEALNSDFNFLLEAFRDLRAIDIDLAEWANTHENVMSFLNYTVSLINDKLSGGGVLGLYRNLVSVLENALPKLINDYGSVAEPAPNEAKDDYGIL